MGRQTPKFSTQPQPLSVISLFLCIYTNSVYSSVPTPDASTVKLWHHQQIASEREIFHLPPLKTFFSPISNIEQSAFRHTFPTNPTFSSNNANSILNGFSAFWILLTRFQALTRTVDHFRMPWCDFFAVTDLYLEYLDINLSFDHLCSSLKIPARLYP